MLITCSKCEMLLRIYRLQLGSLDREECHAHLRCVPLDLSVKPGGANKDLEYFLRQAREGSTQSRLDRYTVMLWAYVKLSEVWRVCRCSALFVIVCVRCTVGNVIFWLGGGEDGLPGMYMK